MTRVTRSEQVVGLLIPVLVSIFFGLIGGWKVGLIVACVWLVIVWFSLIVVIGDRNKQ